ncbi:Methyltransferase domain-containing protein [Candidatus Magnetomoraceae bacterium gMMP-15]
MNNIDKKKYIMEDPDESHRLASKVNPDKFVKRYLKDYLNEASDVLDVGSGPGVIVRSIGEAFPDLCITALDISHQRIREARKNIKGMNNLFAQVGDANFLPFNANSFDLVFARFLLEYLSKPEQAVSEMLRVCRPGGRIFLQDLDGQLVWHYPEDEMLMLNVNKVMKYLNLKTGFDPFIGRKLYSFLHSQGLNKIDVKAESYHLYPGKIDDKNYNLWKLKLDIATPGISAALGSEMTAINWKKAFLDYLLREDTLTYSVVFSVTGLKPK